MSLTSNVTFIEDVSQCKVPFFCSSRWLISGNRLSGNLPVSTDFCACTEGPTNDYRNWAMSNGWEVMVNVDENEPDDNQRKPILSLTKELKANKNNDEKIIRWLYMVDLAEVNQYLQATAISQEK